MGDDVRRAFQLSNHMGWDYILSISNREGVKCPWTTHVWIWIDLAVKYYIFSLISGWKLRNLWRILACNTYRPLAESGKRSFTNKERFQSRNLVERTTSNPCHFQEIYIKILFFLDYIPITSSKGEWLLLFCHSSAFPPFLLCDWMFLLGSMVVNWTRGLRRHFKGFTQGKSEPHFAITYPF